MNAPGHPAAMPARSAGAWQSRHPLAGMAPSLGTAWLALHARPGVDQLVRADLLLLGRYSAIGHTHPVSAHTDWRANPCADAEWLIALHKLPMLVDLAQAWRHQRDLRHLRTWADLATAWLEHMGTGELSCSDAQVEAKRVEHCVLALALLQHSDGLQHLPEALLATLRDRIADEAGYILAHLKPARNHRTFQLYAVVLAGLVIGPCLDEPAARSQAAAQALAATELLCANLLSDFGADGVHCELSSHYHQITLETALSFVAVCRAADLPLPEALHERLRLALRFACWITLPDGEIPLVNDADNGDHRPMLALGAALYADAMAQHLATGGRQGRPIEALSHHFDTAGYVVMRDRWGHGPAGLATAQHVFFDCGAPGAGSHAHYDLFSLCWTAGGRQVIVDPGRYTYNAEPDAQGIDWRYQFKRTAAHNTVCIDRLDQTRYLSKAGRPAAGLHKLDRSSLAPGASKHGPAVQRIDPQVHLGRHSDVVLAGALSAEYEPIHTRCLVFVQRQYLLVLDQVSSGDGQPHDAALHLQLAAHWQGQVTTGTLPHGLALRAPGWQILLHAPDADARLGSAWVSRSYGDRQPAPQLAATSRFVGRTGYATLLTPDSDELHIVSMHADLRDDHAQVCVQGLCAGEAFTDHFALRWPTRTQARPGVTDHPGAYQLERRQGGQCVSTMTWPAAQAASC
ncbi:MAG: hypothetical protein RLZZ584_1051 [Pseudomonadota bacterium]